LRFAPKGGKKTTELLICAGLYRYVSEKSSDFEKSDKNRQVF